MDIFKRAYFARYELHKEDPVIRVFHQAMVEQIKEWIKKGGYNVGDWPRELGPLPDDLKSRKEAKS